MEHRPIEDPLPKSSFGSTGIYVEVDFEPGRERPLVSVPYSRDDLGHVDETTLRLFEVDVEARAFALVESSAVDLDEQRVQGRVDRPGIYGVIGLPSDPRVVEAVSLFEELRPELLRDRGGLQPRICELILCAPEGSPWGPGGDICDLCHGIRMPDAGLPEIQIFKRPKRPDREVPCVPPARPVTDWKVLAWGLNDAGQVGDGSTTDRYSEVWVADVDHVTAVTGGGYGYFGGNFSLAVAADGTVWGWGDNAIGQLGLASPASTLTPIPAVAGVAPVKQVAAGNGFAVALKGDGTVWAWGDSSSGQLGTPGTFPQWSHSSTPVQIAGLPGVVAVAAGAVHALALAADGKVWSWGAGNHVPAEVAGVDQVVAIGAGSEHSLAVRSDGSVWGWGKNDKGQLGTGAPSSPQPAAVPGISDAKAVDGGLYHSVVLKADGTVWASGENLLGQLGDGTNTDRPSMDAVPGLTGIASVAAGGGHNLALSTAGVLWAWGYNNWGQVGDGTAQFPGRSSPVEVVGPPVLEHGIGCGVLHSLALAR